MDPRVFRAVENGSISEIEGLHKENSQLLSEVTFKKSNVLHIAARKGHFGIVRWILDHVQDSSMCVARNSYLNTPLHEAALAGNADLIRIFIPQAPHTDLFSFFISLFQRGSNERINWVNMFGETPLLIACRNGHKEAATLLLEKSTPMELRFPKYQPCLHVAASGGHLGVVSLLLSENNMEKFGEVWMMRDGHGATPLHAAIYGGHIDIVQEIVKAVLSTSWREWLMTAEDSDGNCAIHVAILKGKYDIVEQLMLSTPDCIEIRSADGNTALHLAVKNAVDSKLVEYLVSFPGVNVNAVNNKGLTPLDIAVTASTTNFPSEIIRLLEEHRASANYKLQSNDNEVTNEVTGCLSKEKVKEEMENKVMDVDTLVASLIATVTFAAIFQVPGGIEDENVTSVNYGAARLTFQPFFTLFLVSDTIALFTSLIVVIGWIFGERLQKRSAETKSIYMFLSALSLGVSIASTAFAFLSTVFLVIIPPGIKALKDDNIPGHKNAFHKYYEMYRMVVYLSTIPMIIAILVQTCCLCWKRVGHTWREKAAAVILLGMAAMFTFFCCYVSQVEKQVWG